MCGRDSSNWLGNHSRLCGRLRSGPGQRLGRRCRSRCSSGRQFALTTTRTTGPKQPSLGDGSGGNLLGAGSGFRHRVRRLAWPSMDRAALVGVVVSNSLILDSLDSCQFPGLLVVFDAFSNLQIEGSAQYVGQMGEELCLENTGKQRIRLLSTNNKRKPVILEVRGADGFNSTGRDRPFRRDLKLVVDNALCHDINIFAGLLKWSASYLKKGQSFLTNQNNDPRGRLAGSAEFGDQYLPTTREEHRIRTCFESVGSQKDG